VAGQAWELAGLAWRLPKRLDAVLTRVEDGTLPLSAPRLETAVDRLDRTARRAVSALLFGTLLIAGALVRPDHESLGTVLMGASALPLLHALFAARVRR
jgi:hypothetical protein